jgi:hypothetical protein
VVEFVSTMSFTRIEFPRDVPKPALPACDWVYFATPSGETWATTRKLIDECRMIIRSAYNIAGIAIANARQIREGDSILMVYGGGDSKKPYRGMFSCTVVAPPIPVPGFEGFSFADSTQHDSLQKSDYAPDPQLNRFTGISIEVSQDLSQVPCEIPKPRGINTIRRWNEVFGGTRSTLDKR